MFRLTIISRWTRAARAVVLCLGALGLAACADDPISPQVRELAEAEALWRASSARDGYMIAQARDCFCTTRGSYAVTVIRDTIISVRDLTTGDEVPANERAWFRTVNELFGEVRQALATPGVLRQVEYDLARGIPTTVSLDPIRNAVDDEVVYRTTFVGAVGARAQP